VLHNFLFHNRPFQGWTKEGFPLFSPPFRGRHRRGFNKWKPHPNPLLRGEGELFPLSGEFVFHFPPPSGEDKGGVFAILSPSQGEKTMDYAGLFKKEIS